VPMPCPCSCRSVPRKNSWGVVDLIKMKAIYWDDSTQGMKFEEKEIPADMQAQCKEYHDKMVEAAAEANEAFMEKYLGGEALTTAEIKQGLRERNLKLEIRAGAMRQRLQEQGCAGGAPTP